MRNNKNREYNPKISNGYGGYIPRDAREKETLSQRRHRKDGGQVKEAKQLLDNLIVPLVSEKRSSEKLSKKVKHNPVLRKNRRLMKKIRNGLSTDDVTYLKNLARSI